MIQHAKQRVCNQPVESDLVITHSQQHLSVSPASPYYQASPNWAGYEAYGRGFDVASGSWIVPCYVSSNSPSGSSATQWVGIGFNSIWQAGTTSYPSQGYRFWYETVPDILGHHGAWWYGPPVSCGNWVAIYVDYNYTSSNQSYVYMSNYTKNQYASKTVNFPPDEQTAEWIDERSACMINGNPVYSQLADFQSTNWLTGKAQSIYIDNNNSHYIGYFQNLAFLMGNNSDGSGQGLAFPGALSSDGSSFTDSWYANGSYNGCSL
jgi:hypothetical protein